MQSRIAIYDHDGIWVRKLPRDISDRTALRTIWRNGNRPDFRDSRDGTGTRIARWTDDSGQLVKVTMVPNAYAVTG